MQRFDFKWSMENRGKVMREAKAMRHDASASKARQARLIELAKETWSIG